MLEVDARKMMPKVDTAVQPFGTSLPRTVLDIAEKNRSNLFAWRGQFSPQLVEALLRSYAPSETTVLDPFMGSGTVLVEAAARGHAVHGCEVNPAAYSMARLYEFCNVSAAQRSAIVSRAEAILRSQLGSQLPLLADDSEHSARGTRERILQKVRGHDEALVRALLEATLLMLDGTIEDGSSSVLASWKKVKAAVESVPAGPRPVTAHLADARALPLHADSVGFVLSSPPYINVFNYHHYYRASVEFLGWDPLRVARSEIGSNRKFRQNRFLTVVQYCIDMALVLMELDRVCSADARLILVVGRESNVELTPFFNSAIVSSLATSVCGFSAVCQQERVFQNRFGQNIYEDLLHLAPGRHGDSAKVQGVIASARRHGVEVLRDARKRAPIDRLRLLDQAIEGAGAVLPSPIAKPSELRTATAPAPIP